MRDAQYAVEAGDRVLSAANNGSERALRPCVTFRKITNGFRTGWGARLYADIRGVIETARRRAIGALEAIRLTLAGKTLQPGNRRDVSNYVFCGCRTAPSPICPLSGAWQ